MSQTLFEPGCLRLRLPRLENSQRKYSRIDPVYVPSCFSSVVPTSSDTRVVPDDKTLTDDLATVPDVAEGEGEERGSRKGLEVDWRMAE